MIIRSCVPEGARYGLLAVVAMAAMLVAGCTREERREQETPVARVTLPAEPLRSPRAAPERPVAQVPARPAATAPPAPPAAPAGASGPDDILLVPIAGTDKKRDPTPFGHRAHYDDYGYECAVCHHETDSASLRCSDAGCHVADACGGETVGPKDKACPPFQEAYHLRCTGCHREDGGPTKCQECHSG